MSPKPCDPLLLPQIVERIFDWLPPEVVKSCRLVSKIWNYEAMRNLRKKKVIKFQLRSHHKVQKLMSLDPCSRAYYESFLIGPVFQFKDTRLQSLFTEVGRSMTCLDLSKSKWANHPSLRKFLARKCPNLETLIIQLLPPESPYCLPNWTPENPAHKLNCLWKLRTIEFRVDYSYYWTLEEQHNIKPYLKHLLSGMPGLNTITCPKYPENFIETFQYEVQILFRESPNLRPILTLLSEADGPALPRLKNINIPLKFWTNITKLQEKKYPLETLEWFIGLEVTSLQMHSFLTQCGPTLKRLCLDFTTAGRFLREWNFRPCQTFPSAISYQKMESLSLRSFKGSLGFILQIPALRTLSLTKARNLGIMFPEPEFRPDGTRYSSLLNVHIDQHNPKDAVTSGTLRRMAHAFDALRKLELRFLSDATLRIVFEAMPTLEELIAVDGLYTDSGVTGIPDGVLDNVYRTKQGIPPKGVARHRQGPYIGSMKNLRKLKLRSKHLTDLTIFFGILDCAELTSLSIMAYGFTNESLMKIADEMSLSFFETVYCNQLTVPGLEYITSKMPHCELSLNELQKPLNGLDIYRLGLFQSGTLPVRRRPAPSMVSSSSSSRAGTSRTAQIDSGPPPAKVQRRGGQCKRRKSRASRRRRH